MYKLLNGMYFGGSLLKAAAIALKSTVPDYKNLKQMNAQNRFIPELEATGSAIEELNKKILDQHKLIEQLKKEKEVNK